MQQAERWVREHEDDDEGEPVDTYRIAAARKWAASADATDEANVAAGFMSAALAAEYRIRRQEWIEAGAIPSPQEEGLPARTLPPATLLGAGWVAK